MTPRDFCSLDYNEAERRFYIRVWVLTAYNAARAEEVSIPIPVGPETHNLILAAYRTAEARRAASEAQPIPTRTESILSGFLGGQP